MSTLEQAQPAGEARERGVLVREFDAAVTAGDGRTIDMRIVPFGERATLADGFGGVPVGEPYEEEWMPGCFDKQLRAADKIYLNFQHDSRLAGIIGRGVTLRAADDGYHGSFRLLSGPDSDKALELVHEKVLTGASLEVPVRTLRSQRSRDGVIQRVKGHLDAVALCRFGAFAGAIVTAVRDAEMAILDEEFAPEIDPEILERCERLGIALPARYAAEAIERSFTEEPWDGSASRWATADDYCNASAIDLNPAGKPKTKNLCFLPFREPGSGDVNLNGVRAALSRIGQGDPKAASQAQRDAAKTKLEGLLAEGNDSAGITKRAAGYAAVDKKPPADPPPAAGDAAATGRIDAMIAMGQNFLNEEDDPEDKAAMSRVLVELRQLRGKETTETT